MPSGMRRFEATTPTVPMKSVRHLNTWLGAAISLFLVFVLPSCWYGQLARTAAATGSANSNSSSNNNEERHEHEDPGEEGKEANVSRAPAPPAPARRAVTTRVAAMGASTLGDSVAPAPH